MSNRLILRLLFSLILIGMLTVTVWASYRQPLWQWGGMHGADAPWTLATLADAYAGFLTFFIFICLRERRLVVRIGWLTALLLLGNIAVSFYLLRALHRLPADAPLSQLWQRR
jgi:hypothetical protein